MDAARKAERERAAAAVEEGLGGEGGSAGWSYEDSEHAYFRNSGGRQGGGRGATGIEYEIHLDPVSLVASIARTGAAKKGEGERLGGIACHAGGASLRVEGVGPVGDVEGVGEGVGASRPGTQAGGGGAVGRPRAKTFWVAFRHGLVALGLGTRAVADTVFLVLQDPDPSPGVRSIGFSLLPDERGGGGGGRRGGVERGGEGRSKTMSVFRIFMGKKLCRQVAPVDLVFALLARELGLESPSSLILICLASSHVIFCRLLSFTFAHSWLVWHTYAFFEIPPPPLLAQPLSPLLPSPLPRISLLPPPQQTLNPSMMRSSAGAGGVREWRRGVC